MQCKVCGSEMEYNPQEQEYPGAKVWPASWYCEECDEIEYVSVTSGIRENTRGW